MYTDLPVFLWFRFGALIAIVEPLIDTQKPKFLMPIGAVRVTLLASLHLEEGGKEEEGVQS